MTPLYSSFASSLSESAIRRAAGEIKTLRDQGIDVLNLTVGDFDPNTFPVPQELKDSVAQAYANNLTNYPNGRGEPALANAVSRYLTETQGLEVSPSDIVIGAGARGLIYAIYKMLVDPGDTVLFPAPSWNNNYYAEFVGATGVALETSAENNFLPTAADIEPHIQTARLIALCSPQNPTGTVFAREALTEITTAVVTENKRREEASERPLFILFDHMYCLLAGEDSPAHHPAQLVPEAAPYVITVDGVSKVFAATGVRVGWAYGPSSLMGKIASMISHLGAWAPKPEQHAVASVYENLEGVRGWATTMRQRLGQRLWAIHTTLQELKDMGHPADSIQPQGGLYISAKFDLATTNPNLTTGEDIRKYILEKTGLGILPFSAFGADAALPWFRISVGTLPDDGIEDMCNRLREIFE